MLLLRVEYSEKLETKGLRDRLNSTSNINPFPANVLILYPLKTPENQRFETLARNGLTERLDNYPNHNLSKIKCTYFIPLIIKRLDFMSLHYPHESFVTKFISNYSATLYSENTEKLSSFKGFRLIRLK